MEERRELLEKIDKKMQDNEWDFVGVIMDYNKAWKGQAPVYKKNGHYIVSGLDSTGDKELLEPIDEKEAERKTKESLTKITKLMIK
ncbi:MAG: hypothetical protein V5A68_06465 [Candidatus Thermoplasmatota archaeon]